MACLWLVYFTCDNALNPFMITMLHQFLYFYGWILLDCLYQILRRYHQCSSFLVPLYAAIHLACIYHFMISHLNRKWYISGSTVTRSDGSSNFNFWRINIVFYIENVPFKYLIRALVSQYEYFLISAFLRWPLCWMRWFLIAAFNCSFECWVLTNIPILLVCF